MSKAEVSGERGLTVALGESKQLSSRGGLKIHAVKIPDPVSINRDDETSKVIVAMNKAIIDECLLRLSPAGNREEDGHRNHRSRGECVEYRRR